MADDLGLHNGTDVAVLPPTPVEVEQTLTAVGNDPAKARRYVELLTAAGRTHANLLDPLRTVAALDGRPDQDAAAEHDEAGPAPSEQALPSRRATGGKGRA